MVASKISWIEDLRVSLRDLTINYGSDLTKYTEMCLNLKEIQLTNQSLLVIRSSVTIRGRFDSDLSSSYMIHAAERNCRSIWTQGSKYQEQRITT